MRGPSVDSFNSNRTARGGEHSNLPTGVTRMLASSVQHPGDNHVWELRVCRMAAVDASGDVAQPPAGGGGGEDRLVLASVRVVFDAESGLLGHLPTATTHFDLHLPAADPPEGPDAVRRRATALALGSASMACHLTADCTEAVFMACLPRWCVALATVRCEVRAATPENAATRWSLRYAVNGSVQWDLTAPPRAPSDPERTLSNGPLPSPGAVGRKLAVIVGVSKYSARAPSDLQYADDDVVHWFNYLRRRNYDVKVYGDMMSPYPAWHGPATVLNVRGAVRKMVEAAHGPHDRVAFIMSGHGDRDSSGGTYLCLLSDPSRGRTEAEVNGHMYDGDLAADLGMDGNNRARTWIFLDCCRSGGLIDGLVRTLPCVVGTTTATRDGQGYELSVTQSGAWTNEFLLMGLKGGGVEGLEEEDLCEVFRAAYARYVRKLRKVADAPCFFGRFGDRSYNTERQSSEAVRALPVGVFRVADWL